MAMGWRWTLSLWNPFPLPSWDHPLDTFHAHCNMDRLRERSLQSSLDTRHLPWRNTLGQDPKGIPPLCMHLVTNIIMIESQKVTPHIMSHPPLVNQFRALQFGGPSWMGSASPHLYPTITQMHPISLLHPPVARSHPRTPSMYPKVTL